MSVFGAILKNLFWRAWAARGEYAVCAMLLVVVAQIALFVTLPSEGSLRVAVVGPGAASSHLLAGVPRVTVTYPRREPDLSDLALGRLDAVVRVAADGSAVVERARSRSVETTIATLLGAGAPGAVTPPPTAPGAVPRGMPSSLMGIWLMFLLLVGVMCGRFYAQDKERRMLHRLGQAPVRAGTYLAAQGIFTFLLCFVPALLTVLVEGALMGNGLGLSLPAWLLVLGCTAALASTFALLIETLMPDEDQAVSVASMATLFTTLLSGSFIAPAAQGGLLRAVSTIMPQRAIMELTGKLEAGDARIGASVAIVVAVIAAFGLTAYLVTASRLRRGKW